MTKFFLFLLFLLPLLLLLSFLRCSVSSLMLRYNGYKLFRVELSPAENDPELLIQWLEEVEERAAEEQRRRLDRHLDLPELGRHHPGSAPSLPPPPPLLDVWSSSPSRIDLLVAPEFEQYFLSSLRRKGIESAVRTIRENIQKDIDRERAEMIRRKRRRRRRRAGKDTMDLFSYNPYSKIEQYLKRTVAENPGVASLVNLSKTSEGRDLLGIRIGRTDEGEGEQLRQMVYIDGGVHAREWIAPAAALYLVDKLISSWRFRLRPAAHPSAPSAPPDPSLTMPPSLLDQFLFVIVPVANPDGYAYSMGRDRLWRKTRSRNESMHGWCVGADANRNWGYRWAENGASRSPCSNIFPGWTPFSEPEVRAVRDYLVPKLPRLTAYLSLHSYGQLILSPWGYSTAKPANYAEQQKLAEITIDAIRRSTGTEYTFGTIADLLYPASGTSIDYWQHRGVPYIYGVELRPEEVENELHGFAIPPEQIEPSGREMFTMVKQIVEYLSERSKRRRAHEKEEEEEE